MKILSINAEHTKNHDDVSFDIDESISQEVIEQANKQAELEGKQIRLSISNSLLRVEGDDVFIPNISQDIERYIETAKKRLELEKEKAISKHKKMLEDLSEEIGLSVNWEKYG